MTRAVKHDSVPVAHPTSIDGAREGQVEDQGRSTGPISRRRLLSIGGALGIGLPVHPLSPQGALAQDATPEARPAGSTLSSPPGFDQSLTGRSISVALGPDGPGRGWENALVDQFTADTGVEVTLLAVPDSPTDRMAGLLQVLNGQSPEIDAMLVDATWPAMLAPHALDLSSFFADIIGDYFPAFVQAGTIGGVLVGFPVAADAGVLYGRSDLMQKYALVPPTTWNDLAAAALAIQTGERQTDLEFNGLFWQGAPTETLFCNALEWIASNGGGVMIDSDGLVTVDNQLAADALARAAGWVGTISPENVINHGETDSRALWAAGHGAFVRDWASAWPVADQQGSRIAGTVTIAPLPRGDGENAARASCLSGQQMMVSRYSANPDAAALFCRYLATARVQESALLERSWLPTRHAVYDDPDLLIRIPHLATLKPILEGGMVARPAGALGRNYPDAVLAAVTAFHGVLTGSIDVATALQSVAGDFRALVGSEETGAQPAVARSGTLSSQLA